MLCCIQRKENWVAGVRTEFSKKSNKVSMLQSRRNRSPRQPFQSNTVNQSLSPDIASREHLTTDGHEAQQESNGIPYDNEQ